MDKRSVSINGEEFDLFSEILPHGVSWLAFISFLVYIYVQDIVQ